MAAKRPEYVYDENFIPGGEVPEFRRHEGEVPAPLPIVQLKPPVPRSGRLVGPTGIVFSQALHDAARRNDVATVLNLVRDGKNNPDDPDTSGFTALHIAAREGDAAVMEVLLFHGANANAKSRTLITPLHRSAGTGHQRCTKLLLQYEADINAQTNYGWTPLAYAAYNGHDDTVAILMHHPNIDVGLTTTDGRTPADLAKLVEIRKHIEDWLIADAEKKRALAAIKRVVIRLDAPDLKLSAQSSKNPKSPQRSPKKAPKKAT